jgi:hypothetical protein
MRNAPIERSKAPFATGGACLSVGTDRLPRSQTWRNRSGQSDVFGCLCSFSSSRTAPMAMRDNRIPLILALNCMRNLALFCNSYTIYECFIEGYSLKPVCDSGAVGSTWSLLFPGPSVPAVGPNFHLPPCAEFRDRLYLSTRKTCSDNGATQLLRMS